MGEISSVSDLRVSTAAAGLVQPADNLKKFNLNVQSDTAAPKKPLTFTTPAQEDLVYRQALQDRLDNLTVFKGSTNFEKILNGYALQGIRSLMQQVEQAVAFQIERPPVLILPTIPSKTDLTEKAEFAIYPSVGGLFKGASAVVTGLLVKPIANGLSLSGELSMNVSTMDNDALRAKATVAINFGKDPNDETLADTVVGASIEQNRIFGTSFTVFVKK